MTRGTAGNALVGVDVGGSGVKAALVDLADGRATGRVRVDTPQPATPDAIASAVAGLVHQFPVGGAIGCTPPAGVTNGGGRPAAPHDPSLDRTAPATIVAAGNHPPFGGPERRRPGRNRQS